MKVLNSKLQANVPFEKYLSLPGWSHSLIKSDGKEWKAPTQKMLLGTSVHEYLLEPDKYNRDNIDIVRPIAIAIKNKLGMVLLKHLQPEIMVTADFIHNGFGMAYKGRLDLCIPGRLVIDIKVSDVPLKIGIARFGYDDQQNGYIASVGAKIGLILRIAPSSCGPGKTPVIEIYNVPINTQWWEWQIVHRGRVLAA